jgi:hypothetical protein
VHAMSSVSIEGEIVDSEGIKITDFNGHLDIKMFDKKTNYRTLANDQTSNAVNFNYFSKMLYRGKVTVKNGEFKASFMLPKDLSFNYGKAKISYYAVDTSTYDDAIGVFGNLIVGGTDETVTIDQNGPEIEMYLNNTDFVSGDIILPFPVFFARISDPQGVNYLGTSIGRDIVLTLNDQSSGAVIINSYYTPEIDNFTTGKITYNLNDLPVGSYTLELKAWDLHNNPSTKSIDFVIETFDKLVLTNVFNYPNPFRGETSFTFRHNQQDGLFEVVLDIYTISGKWVTTHTTTVESVNQESLPIYWNGKDNNGKPISTGSYVYSIQITDAEKRQTVVNQKFVYFR